MIIFKYMYKKIYLNHNKFTIVDEEDYMMLNQYKWRYNTTGYATRTSRNISMSRIIMKAKTGEYIDHINRNRLDNRKSNLRIVTNQQNCWNSGKNKRNNYKGVSKLKNNKWRAYISVENKQIHLGRFLTLEDAIKERNKAVKKYYGKYGFLTKL